MQEYDEAPFGYVKIYDLHYPIKRQRERITAAVQLLQGTGSGPKWDVLAVLTLYGRERVYVENVDSRMQRGSKARLLQTHSNGGTNLWVGNIDGDRTPYWNPPRCFNEPREYFWELVALRDQLGPKLESGVLLVENTVKSFQVGYIQFKAINNEICNRELMLAAL